MVNSAMPLCECGCGQETKRSHGGKRSTTPSGQYFRFVVGHYLRVGHSTRFYKKRDGRALHIQRAERALGKPLPRGAVVHHADGTMNPDGPLVICQDQGYHRFLHSRMRIRALGGHPDTHRVCRYCKTAKPLADFVRITKPANVWHCLICSRLNSKRRKERLRAQRQVA